MFVLDRTREKKTVKKLQSKQVAEVVARNSEGTHSIVRDHQNRHWMTVPEPHNGIVSLYPMKSNLGD